MLTQEVVNVLLIALIANALVVLALVAGPRVRSWTRGRDHAERFATAGSHVGSAGREFMPLDHDRDEGHAAAAWFPQAGSEWDGSSDGALTEVPLAAVADLPAPDVWSRWLDEESARAARYHRPATIVLVELTGLDRLAERVGSGAADRLMPPVATTIRRFARNADRVAQLSATRFGILLVETDEISAINYVERVRSTCDLWLAAGAVALRLSIGWAELRADRSADAALREAEQRLFAERRRAEASSTAEAPEVRDSRDPSIGVFQPSGTAAG
jgi:diguanylate cyclase (GGDEF)-like protein